MDPFTVQKKKSMDPFAVQFFQQSLLSLLLVIKSVRIQKGSGDKKAFKQQTLHMGS